jgi:hypothetical protein
MQYYAEFVTLVSNPLDNNFQLPELTNTQSAHLPVSLKYINPSLRLQFQRVGLSIGGAVLFYKSKKTIGALHSDIVWDDVTDSWQPWHAAINWDLYNTRSSMYWYRTNQPGIITTPGMSRTCAGSYLLSGVHYGSVNNIDFKDDPKYTKLDEIDIRVPTLLRTDVPHSVENLDDQPRWCLSIRFSGNPTFDDCLARLT